MMTTSAADLFTTYLSCRRMSLKLMQNLVSMLIATSPIALQVVMYSIQLNESCTLHAGVTVLASEY